MSEEKLLRVFPRKTTASPKDVNAIFRYPTLFDEADSVAVSVTWTWDIPEAERLYKAWKEVTKKITIGGPAFDDPGGEFTPGLYLDHGYVFTSRGCPNKCWFCYTPKREGGIRELSIHDGYNILDSNLLACSVAHIKSVFAMLHNQPIRPRFTGGLDAELMQPWIAKELRSLKPASAFFAYDTPSAFDALVSAWDMLKAEGETNSSRAYQVYTLIGYKNDTLSKAEERLIRVLKLGLMPLAMLYNKGEESMGDGWKKLQREYANKFIIGSKLTALRKEVRE